MIDSEARAILKRYGIVPESYIADPLAELLKGNAYPTTGTATNSRGPARGNQSGPNPASNAQIDAATDLVREVLQEATRMISEGPEDPANADYDSIIDRAVRAVANRLGPGKFVTDWSGDNDNPDPSLNPNGPSVAAANARAGTGPDGIIENMATGFELAKRIMATNDLDAMLLGKLADRSRVGVAGASDALLKHESGGELRKLEDSRAGELDLSRILREPGDEQLVKRLSERGAGGMRKAMDFDVFHGGSSAPFEGSYSGGCLAGADQVADLTKRIDRVHRGGGSEIEKLLH